MSYRTNSILTFSTDVHGLISFSEGGLIAVSGALRCNRDPIGGENGAYNQVINDQYTSWAIKFDEKFNV